MSAFSDAIQDLFAALAGLQKPLGPRVNAVLEVLEKATPEEAACATGPLVEVIARSGEPSIALLGILGRLVCCGVNFWGVFPAYLAGIRYHLTRAAEAERAIRALLPAGKQMAELSQDDARAIYDQLPEAIKPLVESWDLLAFLLGSAMPIFEQLKPFRQLARAMGIDPGWLRDCEGVPDWVAKLPQVLDGEAAADGPLPDPDPGINAALASLREASTRPPQAANSIRQALQPLFQATTFVPPEAFHRAAAGLAEIASQADPAWAAELAGICGGFIERGADPERGVDVLIAGLPRLLDPVVAFVEACRQRGKQGEESPVRTHMKAVAQAMPEAKRALDAISAYCLGTIAHLARSPAARLRHGRNAELLSKLNVVRWDTGNTGFLWKMLQVLEEELVILGPALKLGWKVKISGIGDNFQLHALIGGHLVGRPEDGKYPGVVSIHSQQPEPGPGVPLPPRAVATQTNAPCTGQEPGFSSRIQLWNWTALQKDGTLPANPISAHEHFIWNEGVPADILPFAGVRIVLLGDSTIHRGWNGGRIFPFMQASFEVVETISADMASDWLGRIAAGQG
jgi:hypothetical protein